MPPCRVQRLADGNARQGKAVGVCRGTLLGGTRTEIQDRKGWGSSDERPHGRDEISSCHRPKAYCRVVQGAVRQAKAEHTPPYTAAKKRQRDEVVEILGMGLPLSLISYSYNSLYCILYISKPSAQ